MGRKQSALAELFALCKARNDFVFDNELVKQVCGKYGFKNPFDATKVDSKKILPPVCLENDYALIHLGSGKHQFIKGIHHVFHEFEPIHEEIEWPYRKSLLNEYNTSESNILSVANNQRILHHFAFGLDKEFDNVDISERPKTYFPHRTKTNLSYHFADIKVELENIQIEIDLTIEYQGNICVFEAKNGNPQSFSVYQIYHPFLYYHNASQSGRLAGSVRDIYAIYVTRQKRRGVSCLKLWKYTFRKPEDATSIKLLKSACYQLIQQ
ncbi:MAG: hypothetical protein RMI34_10900 [Chloroherpetonaceae bacterium]|nr:hypothetical protein [Chloroherpetonaceae bacterium]MDW8020569.1 hypothetical protein [Chloroherpetonaceae bacterium]